MIKFAPLPPLDVLGSLLRCDAAAGRLHWRERTERFFNSTPRRSAEWACRQWNARWAGKEAFTVKNNNGYLMGEIFTRSYMAHRIIWKMAVGADPEEIDHIDGNRSNNKIANLRSVSRQENTRNRALPSNNTSGVIGVHKSHWNTWVAVVTIDGRIKRLGSYQTMEAAQAARKRAQRLLGYHENHGRDDAAS